MPEQIEPKIVTKPTFTIVGLHIKAKAMAPEIPQLWDKFIPRMSEIQHSAEPGVSYGLMDNFDQVAMDYVAGNPVEQVTELPVGMARWDVPANTYAVFETTLATIGETFGHIFNNWLPNSGYQQATAPYFERYPESFDPQTNPNLSIYIPVQKKS